jgi:HD-like signal output (HDOD) protein
MPERQADRDVELRRQRIDASLDRLPTLSSAVLKLFDLDAEADDYPSRLGDLLHAEPSLAARILRVANSALSGPEQPVRTVPEAVVRLGARRAGQLLKALTLLRIFTPRTDGEYDLWRHAVQVAVATRVIAGASGQPLDPNEAYLAGLFHDVGRFVMFLHVPPEVQHIEEHGRLTIPEMLEAERAACGYDHCEVGWRACQALLVPASIAVLCRHHHALKPQTGELTASQLRLLRAIQQANSLSCLLLDGRDLSKLPTAERIAELRKACPSDWDWLPVRVEELEMLIDPIVGRSDDLLVALGIDKGH